MIWDTNVYIVAVPGEVVVATMINGRGLIHRRFKVEYPVDLEYRARVKAIFQRMLAKENARYQARKNDGTKG